MLQARTFQFIAALLKRTWTLCRERQAKAKAGLAQDLKRQVFVDKVTTLIVAQQAVPAEWRQPVNLDDGASFQVTKVPDVAGIESCWNRPKP